MPVINQYTRQNLPRQMLQTRASATSFGAYEGQALQGLGQASQALSQKIADVQKKKDSMAYNERMAQLSLDMIKKKKELESTSFSADADLSKVYDDVLTEMSGEYKDQIPQSMVDQFQDDMNQMRVRFVSAGIEDQARRAGIRASMQYENTVVQAENMVALDPSQYDVAVQLVERQGGNLPNMSPEASGQIRNAARKRIDSAHAAATLTKDPDGFLEDAQNGKYNNLPDLDKFLNAAKKQKEVNKALQEKSLIESKEKDIKTKLENEDSIMASITEGQKSADALMLEINEKDLRGEIRDDFAVEARRYLTSTKELNAVTNAEVMSKIVTRMYDLNAMADMNPTAYLQGVNDIKKEIMNRRANGELSKDDEQKLLNTQKTLQNAKVSDATNAVSFSFGTARKMIETQVPPSMRGEAIRNLFYATENERSEGKTRQELRQIYTQKAREVIDNINNQRRARAVEVIQASPPQDIDAQLQEKGYTMNDVKETARKYGITEQQVINKLLSK